MDRVEEDNDFDTSSSTSEAVVPQVYEDWDDDNFIPSDVLFLICTFLTPSDVFCRVRLVCSSWYKRSISDTVWMDMYNNTWKTPHKSSGTWWQLYEERLRTLGQISDKRKSINKLDTLPPKHHGLKGFLVGVRDRVKRATTAKGLSEKEMKTLKNMRKLSSEKATYNNPILMDMLIEACREVLRVNVNCYEAWQALTKTASVGSKHDEVIIYASEGIDAIEKCSESDELKGKDTKGMLGLLHFFRGYALYKQHMFSLSLVDYNSAVALGFKKSTIFYCRMFNYVKLKQLDKAYEDSLIVLSKKTGKNTKKFPNAKLGDYLFRQGKFAESREFFILSHNKNNKVIALKRLFEIDCKLGHHKDAIQWWKKLCRHYEECNRSDFRSIYKSYRNQVKECHMQLAIEKFGNNRVTACLYHLRKCVLLSLNRNQTRGSEYGQETVTEPQLQTLTRRYHIEPMIADHISSLANITEDKNKLTKAYFYLLMAVTHFSLQDLIVSANNHTTSARKYLRKASSLSWHISEKCSSLDELNFMSNSLYNNN